MSDDINNYLVSGYEQGLSKLAGKKLARVLFNKEKNVFAFVSDDGEFAKFGVESDCCSTSWVEHVTITPGAIGSPVRDLRAAHTSNEDGDGDGDEDVKIYELRLRTDHGDVIVEFRNSSNGYYGGNVALESGGLEGLDDVLL